MTKIIAMKPLIESRIKDLGFTLSWDGGASEAFPSNLIESVTVEGNDEGTHSKICIRLLPPCAFRKITSLHVRSVTGVKKFSGTIKITLEKPPVFYTYNHVATDHEGEESEGEAAL